MVVGLFFNIALHLRLLFKRLVLSLLQLRKLRFCIFTLNNVVSLNIVKDEIFICFTISR